MAIRFDATGDQLHIPFALLNNPYTVTGWFKISVDRNAASGLIGIDDNGLSVGDFYFADNDGVSLILYSFDTSANGSVLTVGEWYYLSIVRTSATQLLAYIGTPTAAAILDATVNHGSVAGRSTGMDLAFLNMAYNNDGVWCNGVCGALKVWLAALTADEIKAEQFSILPRRISNLYRAWPCFPGATERVRDYGVNAGSLTAGGTLTDEAGPPVPWQVWAPPQPIFVVSGGTTEFLNTAGSITGTGLIIRLPQTIYNGVDIPIGSIVKDVLFAYTGQIGPSGEPDLGVQTSLSGSVTLSSSMIQTVIKLLDGAITSTGNLIKSIFLSFSGTITATSDLIKMVQVSFSGSITSSSVLVNIKASLIDLAGSIVGLGNIIRDVLTAYTGQTGPGGEPDLGVQTSLVGSITPSGLTSVLKIGLLNLAGAITSSSNLIRSVLTAFTGQVDANGNPIAGVQTSLSGSVGSSGALSLVSSAIVIAEKLFKGMFRGMFRSLR
jgi:hypothetical protein